MQLTPLKETVIDFESDKILIKNERTNWQKVKTSKIVKSIFI